MGSQLNCSLPIVKLTYHGVWIVDCFFRDGVCGLYASSGDGIPPHFVLCLLIPHHTCFQEVLQGFELCKMLHPEQPLTLSAFRDWQRKYGAVDAENPEDMLCRATWTKLAMYSDGHKAITFETKAKFHGVGGYFAIKVLLPTPDLQDKGIHPRIVDVDFEDIYEHAASVREDRADLDALDDEMPASGRSKFRRSL